MKKSNRYASLEMLMRYWWALLPWRNPRMRLHGNIEPLACWHGSFCCLFIGSFWLRSLACSYRRAAPFNIIRHQNLDCKYLLGAYPEQRNLFRLCRKVRIFTPKFYLFQNLITCNHSFYVLLSNKNNDRRKILNLFSKSCLKHNFLV